MIEIVLYAHCQILQVELDNIIQVIISALTCRDIELLHLELYYGDIPTESSPCRFEADFRFRETEAVLDSA